MPNNDNKRTLIDYNAQKLCTYVISFSKEVNGSDTHAC